MLPNRDHWPLGPMWQGGTRLLVPSLRTRKGEYVREMRRLSGRPKKGPGFRGLNGRAESAAMQDEGCNSCRHGTGWLGSDVHYKGGGLAVFAGGVANQAQR